MTSGSAIETHLLTFLEESYGPLWPGIRRELAEVTEFEELLAGQTLMRQGDAPGDAYIVMSGRLRVTIKGEDGAEKVINEVGRGETVGEMALLTDEPRSATLFAVRDSILARLPRASFMRLFEHHPRFASSLNRSVIERLQRQSVGARDRVSPVSTIAVIPIDADVPIKEFTRALCAGVSKLGSVRMLDDGQVDLALNEPGIAQVKSGQEGALRVAAWLQGCEDADDYIVYRADPTWTGWTERCARQADVVLFVGGGRDDSRARETEARLTHYWQQGRAPRRALVLLHDHDDQPEGTAAWLAERKLDQHFHVRRESKADHERLARCVTERAYALVLGGGGAHGIAHIGVLRACEELGIPIDYIGGTSIGAIVGGIYARTQDWDGILREWSPKARRVRDYTWPAVSLLSGTMLNGILEGASKERRIEDLWLPFFSVSTNLTHATPHIHREGPLFDAMRASVSLPGVFPPYQLDGDYLVDGGLLNILPVDVMRRIAGPGLLIAIDPSTSIDLEPDPSISTATSGWGRLAGRLLPFTGKGSGPGIISLLLRANEVGSIEKTVRARSIADLYVDLPAGDFGILDLWRADDIATSGYETSIERLRAWHKTHAAGDTSA